MPDFQCSKCGNAIPPEAEYANRNGVLTCGTCEWSEQTTPSQRPKDTTQGFKDETTYGPPYPAPPTEGKPDIKGKYRYSKRPRCTHHRCDCGTWVREDKDTPFGYIKSGQGRRTLFGRHWCTACAYGHSYAKPVPQPKTYPASLTASESRTAADALIGQFVQNGPGVKPWVLVRGVSKIKGAKKPVEIVANYAFADYKTALSRLRSILKPADNKRADAVLDPERMRSAIDSAFQGGLRDAKAHLGAELYGSYIPDTALEAASKTLYADSVAGDSWRSPRYEEDGRMHAKKLVLREYAKAKSAALEPASTHC